MNLTDYTQTSLVTAFDAVATRAAALGVHVHESRTHRTDSGRCTRQHHTGTRRPLPISIGRVLETHRG